MSTPKYKLVRPWFTGFVGEAPWGKNAQKVYRIKALRDIPSINVKAGQFGGLVTSEMNLSQFGDCWINYNAKVFGHVFVVDSAYIGGNAKVTCDMDEESIVIRGNTSVGGNATITLEENADGSPITDTAIMGNVNITDNANLRNVRLMRGDISISGHAVLDGVAEVTGNAVFKDHVRLNKGVKVSGITFIIDRAVISENATIINSAIDGSTVVFAGDTIKDFNTQEKIVAHKNNNVQDIVNRATALSQRAGNSVKSGTWNSFFHDFDDTFDALGNDLNKLGDDLSKMGDDLSKSFHGSSDDYDWEPGIGGHFKKQGNLYAGKGLAKGSKVSLTRDVPVSSVDAEKQALIDDALLLLKEVNEKHKAYETDIVKIIKYPVMADKSYPLVAELHVALGRANRMSLNPAHTGFVDAVTTAEKAFIAAESYALKMASTVFTEAEKKKVSKVNDLLSIASNDASSDNEKEQAFKQAFKQLEGIIAVPEVAVDAFRVKIGLKELSM